MDEIDLLVVPGEFIVHLGAGRGSPVHDPADILAVWPHAVEVLLSCLEFVWIEIEGIDECHGLLEGLKLLGGAVMAAGIEAAGVGLYGP